MRALDTVLEKRLRQRLRNSLQSIVARHPFFGTLSLFASFEFSDDVDTAATDGQTIWFATDYASKLTSNELSAVIVHELLHCALEHTGRRREREPHTWNVAADIVVNGMIAADRGFFLPAGTIRDADLEHLSVEEVYEQLTLNSSRKFDLGVADLQHSARRQVNSGYWASAREQALAAVRRRDPHFGDRSGGGSRELARLRNPELPWQQLLWQFLCRTPTDFSGFDRRFIGQGLYLDGVEQENLRLHVVIDTSASINEAQLGQFLSEVSGILASYPHMIGSLFFADAEVYGPFPLQLGTLHNRPKGGGGTSFRPYFSQVATELLLPDLCVYFTDGFGEFPKDVPTIPTLWVISPGGRDSRNFPFGQVTRMYR